jgi:hypothetical protein
MVMEKCLASLWDSKSRQCIALCCGDLKSNLLAGLTTPVAPDKEASRLFVDVAATPPHEEGTMPA